MRRIIPHGKSVTRRVVDISSQGDYQLCKRRDVDSNSREQTNDCQIIHTRGYVQEFGAEDLHNDRSYVKTDGDEHLDTRYTYHTLALHRLRDTRCDQSKRWHLLALQPRTFLATGQGVHCLFHTIFIPIAALLPYRHGG